MMTSFATEIGELLEKYAGTTLLENDTPFPIFSVPDRKLAIQAITPENFQDSGVPHAFFQQQKDKYEAKGWKLIHCWQDLWETKNDILRSRIEALFGHSCPVHGRKCRVTWLEQGEADRFMHENHLLGATKAKYRLGLQSDYGLMAVALFGRSVQIERNGMTYQSHEMIRFCNQTYHYVQGGLTRLITHFIREVAPDDIYTSVDRDWSEGQGFTANGFTVVGKTPPIVFWLGQSRERVRIKPCPGAAEVVTSGNLKLLLDIKKHGS